MAKKTRRWIELHTPYKARGELADYKPGTIRVRHISEWGGRSHYYMDGLRWPVPSILRHLDGRTWRGLALALLLLVAGAVAAARLLLAGRR